MKQGDERGTDNGGGADGSGEEAQVARMMTRLRT